MGGKIEIRNSHPYEQASGYVVYLVIALRLIGASLIVPLMEELFWRSFAFRFAIRSDFKSVPLGQFSWFSFIVISLLFGLEHHRWLVGIVAGMVYAGVLYHRKNLFDPLSCNNQFLAWFICCLYPSMIFLVNDADYKYEENP